MNMKEGLCIFMTTVIKCHSLNYYIFNSNMTCLDINQYITTCHKHDIAD